MDPAKRGKAMSALVEIRDLVVRRRGRSVLEVPALDVRKREVLALVGPNGAGKSTLMLVIARLIKPETGKILFDGLPLSEWSALDYRRRISFVFQAPLLLDMTVAENIALGLKFRGVHKDKIRERVEHWLEQLGIEALSSRRASELSGGEAQRVSLARAFVLDPELILLDEPFSALDPPARARLLEDLTALLKADHRTAIIVTHNLKDAAKLGDRVAVLVGGRLRQVGPARQIKNQPADEEVAAFLREMPRSAF
jgi:tungstate transport system ATP-binding protein